MIISSKKETRKYQDDNLYKQDKYIPVPLKDKSFYFHFFFIKSNNHKSDSVIRGKMHIYYDIVRRKIFHVSVSEYDKNEIYTYLLGSYQKDSIGAGFQGKLPIFPIITINTKEELWKQSIPLIKYQKNQVWHTLSLISPKRTSKNISGGGTSKEKKISEEKAISEIIERLCLNDKNSHSHKYSDIGNDVNFVKNSNGMACHITDYEAILNGKKEYIERDNFLLSRLLQKNITPILPETTTADREKKCHCDITHFLLSRDTPGYSILTIWIDRKNNQLIQINSATGYDISNLIQKNNRESCKIDILRQKDNQYTQEQQDFLLKQKNNHSVDVNELQNILLSDFEKQLQKYQRDISHFSHPLLEIFKRYCIKASSPDLLPLYFGEKIPDHIIHHPRLLYRQEKSGVKELNRIPHPLM